MEEDREQYIKLFKDESSEYLNRLNKLVLDLESHPGRKKAITEVFRIFHTLKGMAASLGYSEIESISHGLEEKLEEVKSCGKKISKDIIDRIFDGIDRIEILLDELGGRVEQEESRTGKNKEDFPYIKVTLKKGVDLPAARAAVIIKNINEKAEILDFDPPLEKISAGEMDDVFRIKCENYKSIMETISGFEEVADVSLEWDSSVSRSPRGGVEGIRVNVDMLDNLQNIVGELVVSSSQIAALLRDFKSEKYRRALETHNRSVKELQEIVTKIRLVPLSLIFNKFPRYVRDLSGKMDKKVKVNIEGSDIEVDRSLLEGISDPLIHLIRNAVAHGIEEPEERKKKGKPPEGEIRVTARRVKSDILIEVSDDGWGIPEKEVLLTAYRKGLINEGEMDALAKREIMRFLFIPGFTTKEDVSQVSGRGIGLDVVKDVVRSVGGSVDISTEKDKGTTISLKMPLSMAIIRVYLVATEKQLFALPMTFVDETIIVPEESISLLMGREVMLLRKEVLPVYRFSRIMEMESKVDTGKQLLSCVVVEIENERFALIVDKFRGSSDAVVKPLPTPLDKIKEYTGITIIGDGKPCLILDLPSLRYRRRYEDTGS